MKIDSEIAITSGYTTPCDGYCSVVVYSGGSGFYTLKLDSFSIGLWESGASTQLHSIFVKKGMTITFTDNTGKSAETTFKPIKYK